MSAIRQLMQNGELKLELLEPVLEKYKIAIADWKRDLSIKGKNIGDVLIDSHSLAAFYDEKKAEVYTLKEFIKHLMDEQAGKHNEKIKETSHFDHSDRSIALLINKDPEYIKYRRLGMEVTELAQKLSFICAQFHQRNYTLTNLTNILIAGLKDTTLTSDD